MQLVSVEEKTEIASWSNGHFGWHLESYVLINLFEMQQFAAHHLVKLMNALSGVVGLFSTTLQHLGNMDTAQFQQRCMDQLDATERFLHDLDHESKALELSVSVLQIAKIKKDLRSTDMQGLGQAFGELRNIVELELQTKTFMYVPENKIKYFNESRAIFGNDTLNKFPSIISEVEEAGKCYAAGRNTATVFHLLRIMEAGLKSLGKSFALPEGSNRTWEAILQKADGELAKPLKDRSPGWKDNDAFFSDTTATLRAVKNAWRNPTMHIEKTYTDEVAQDIYNAVRGFMRHLSTKLSE